MSLSLANSLIFALIPMFQWVLIITHSNCLMEESALHRIGNFRVVSVFWSLEFGVLRRSESLRLFLSLSDLTVRMASIMAIKEKSNV